MSVLSGETSETLGLIQRLHGIETEYKELFEGLGCLPGLHHIRIKQDAIPVVHPPRKVPIALKDKVKDELQRMTDLGVIVKQTEPTPWVNSMVTVVKPNGSVRICIDPKDLNNAIEREHYPMKTIEEVTADIPEAKVFTKLDATSGFWQLQLDEESSKLTTFNTPYGRYCFLRAPFGIKSIPEIFQRTMAEMTEGLEGTEVIVDDILVWGTNKQEHDQRLKKVLDKAKAWNLKLSETKCQFMRDEIDYVGHKLTKEGLKADPEKVRAVIDMKEPENVKELQTFLGFITYLQKFLPNMSTVSAPLRILLAKDTQWHWEHEQQKSFDMLKSMASKAPILAYYNKDEELVLNVDASSKGLGAVIMQKDKPIAYASRALNPAQQKYAQIEKETLAIVFGCQKFHQYVYGRHVIVESDHKPLESIFKKLITEAPPRVQRFVMALQKYDITVRYKPGKTMYISDALSRLYLPEQGENLVPDLDVNEIQLNAHLPMSPEKYEQLQRDTATDESLQSLKKLVEDGWPEQKHEVQHSAQVYWQFRDEITSVDGVMFKGLKVIIPTKQRKQMLQLVHESHLGIVKCKSRAREFMYWPGMVKQIEELIGQCEICAVNNKKLDHKEPMIPSDIPNRPSAKIGADLFEYRGKHYLLTVDYYSKWPEVEKLDNLSSANVIAYLKRQFCRFGYVDELITDNGPQFASREFKKFAKDYGFVHTTTSPYYSQANGQTERFVQTVKNMLRKSNEPSKALLDYRNTPLEGIQLSPAQLHLGRRLKSSLPATAALLEQKTVEKQNVSNAFKQRQTKQKFYYDKRNGKHHKSLRPGDPVMVRHNREFLPGSVIKPHEKPRSYIIETMDGRQFRRNRYHLKPTRANFPKFNDTVTMATTNSGNQLDSKVRGTTKKSKMCASENRYQSSENQASENKCQPSENQASENQSCENKCQSSENQCSSSQVVENSSALHNAPVSTRAGRIVKPPRKFDDFICNAVENLEVFV